MGGDDRFVLVVLLSEYLLLVAPGIVGVLFVEARLMDIRERAMTDHGIVFCLYAF